MECGHVRIPRIKVTNRRKPPTSAFEALPDAETKGENVKIIDIRMGQQHSTDISQPKEEQSDGLGTILVLPY
jgi:hypothetical protein